MFRRLVPTEPIALGCLHHRLALTGTRVGLSSIVRTIIFPPSCVPFAPRELPRFFATTDALTSSREALRPARGMNTVLSQADLPASCAWPSDRSVSNHRWIVQRPRGISPCRSLDAREFCSPDRLRHFPAGSPHTADRIEFTLSSSAKTMLRTGLSRSVAPHPVFPRRSYSSIQHASSAHRSGLPPLQPSTIAGALERLALRGVAPRRAAREHGLHYTPYAASL